MLLALSLAPIALLFAAAAYRRRRARVAVARLDPGRMVIYTTIARSRRW
jgi:hypothetical protein